MSEITAAAESKGMDVGAFEPHRASNFRCDFGESVEARHLALATEAVTFKFEEQRVCLRVRLMVDGPGRSLLGAFIGAVYDPRFDPLDTCGAVPSWVEKFSVHFSDANGLWHWALVPKPPMVVRDLHLTYTKGETTVYEVEFGFADLSFDFRPMCADALEGKP